MLERVRPAVSSETIFGGTDGYFTPILHAITGTNVIDRLLNAYRVHGANDFSTLPGIVGVSSSYGEAEARSYATAKLTIVSLIDRIGDIVKTVPATRFWQILDTVASTSRGQQMFSEREVKEALTRQYFQLTSLFGERHLIGELLHRMKRRDCLDIVFAVRKGVEALPALRRVGSVEIRRKLRKIRIGG
jgi:hypothetical protein